VVDVRRQGGPPSVHSLERTWPQGASWTVTRGLAETIDLFPDSQRWVDLDPAVSVESSIDQLASELLDPGDDALVAFRGGERFVADRETAEPRGMPETGAIGPIAALHSVDPAARRQHIIDSVCSELARTLRLPAHAIERDRPMVSFGLDSLLAIQLKNRVEDLAGVSVSVVKLLEGLTVAQLAALIDEAVAPADRRPEQGNGVSTNGQHPTPLTSQRNGAVPGLDSGRIDDTIDGIDDLSESELDSLIDELLIKTDEHD
jgi:hypothetical protein